MFIIYRIHYYVYICADINIRTKRIRDRIVIKLCYRLDAFGSTDDTSYLQLPSNRNTFGSTDRRLIPHLL